MDSTLIANLKDIRNAARDNCATAQRMGRKFLGPQPEDGNAANKPAQESVQSLVSEIMSLTGYCGKLLADGHSFLGEFTPEPSQLGQTSTPRFG